MSVTREKLVFAAFDRAIALTDYNIHNDINKQFLFVQQTVLADKSLTKSEKLKAIKMLNKYYDHDKIRNNTGEKRICENCQKECFAASYCENCIRNYLKENFSNWTSGNNNIDDLIKKCQIETYAPDMIVEWIPYNNLQNIQYLTKGGFSEICIADLIGGYYKEWNSDEQTLERSETKKVILKTLKDVESANRSWFDEAKSHLTINSKCPYIVQCYGLTQNPLNEDYMLIMRRLDIDLKKYLQQNHHRLTWKERVRIVVEITSFALNSIHKENAVHRDLHSGNILHSQYINFWFISDFGFCGPADRPLGSIYGNLPYIAPEIICGKEYTFASDIYSIAMIMWEISSGQPPFINYENDYELAMNIVNGIRPKIVSGTPLEYKELMEQCWDADPAKRPNIKQLLDKINDINKSHYKNISNNNIDNNNTNNIIKKFFKKFKLFRSFQQNTNNLKINENLKTNYVNSSVSSKLFASNIYQFDNLPEPRNATEEEQEAFHSKPYDFSIPDDSFIQNM